jgi:hypothetical protein
VTVVEAGRQFQPEEGLNQREEIPWVFCLCCFGCFSDASGAKILAVPAVS